MGLKKQILYTYLDIALITYFQYNIMSDSH